MRQTQITPYFGHGCAAEVATFEMLQIDANVTYIAKIATIIKNCSQGEHNLHLG